MTSRVGYGWVPPAAAALSMTGLAVAIFLSLNRTPAYPEQLTLSDVAFAVPFIAFAVMGGAVLRAQPQNLDGWAMLTLGTLVPVGIGLIEAGRQQYGPTGNASAALVAWFGGQILLKPGFMALAFVLLLFPDGQLPGRRWRWLVWPALVLVLLAEASNFVTPGRVDDGYGPANPVRISGNTAGLATAFTGALGLAGVALFVLAAAISMVVRHRRADVVVRRQLQVVGFVAAVVALCWIMALGIKGLVRLPPDLKDLDGAILGISTAGLAVAMGLAILRGRLIEPGLVVSRTLAYGSLVGVITAAYVLVVAGAGVAAGGRLSLPLAGLITAALALTLQPLRVQARRLADRVVYGRRAEPYEVLAEFTRRVASTLPAENEVSAMARVLAEGTGSPRAEVWAATPAGRQLLTAAGDQLAGIATEAEVTHHGQITGWLRLVRRPGDPLKPREERLLGDLAHQAGMVLEQARLTSELRASRRRLVMAQDQERERLERDLHDGAQQHLLALSARIGMLPEPQAGVMKEEVAAAMDSLREVARGLYPKLLESGGLRPALSAQARRLPMPVKVSVAGERLPREVEVAIYYCCSEALQNVARHSGARRARLVVTSTAGVARFEVVDDGCGIGATGTNRTSDLSGAGLRNMRDRLEALDGTLEIESAPGRGTAVSGYVPLRTASSPPLPQSHDAQ